MSGKLSESKEVKTGVPQGSVLDPSLFILYIKNHCHLELFAVDGTLYTSNTALQTSVAKDDRL